MAIEETVAAERKRLAEQAQKDVRSHLECAQKAVVKWLCIERDTVELERARKVADLIGDALVRVEREA